MKFLRGYTREEISWMMYDWANSAHSVVVVTILPVFFNQIATARGMTAWGYATSAAMLIVALLAPVLGAFGDFRGYRKKLFFGFMLLGALSCAALAATPLMDLSTHCLLYTSFTSMAPLMGVPPQRGRCPVRRNRR